MQSRPDFETRYLEYRKVQMRKAYSNGVQLGLAVVPFLGMLDWFMQRQHILELMLLRGGLFVMLLVAHLLARRSRYPGGIAASATGLILLGAAISTWMCAFTGGFASVYFGGNVLLVLMCSLFFPGTVRTIAFIIGGIFCIYLFGMLLAEPTPAPELPLFIANLTHLATTGVIGLTGVAVNESARRESFERLLRAEDAEAIREAHAAATRALAIRDEFISIASHELKTPLTSMKLQNDLWKRQFGTAEISRSPEQARGWIERNEKQIRRLLRLVDDMLDISRINVRRFNLQRERFDLGEVVREACERFRTPLEQAGIRLQLRISGPVVGSWDRVRLEQVVTNLLSNAVKYAPGSLLEVMAWQHESSAVIRVQDHGEGISPENQRRIFERYERAHSADGTTGLGLGLYISSKIVESHGGRIWVESERGQGSAFVVELPVDGVAMAGRSGEAPELPSTDGVHA